MTLAAKIMPPARGGPEHERDEFAAAARGGAVVLEAPSGYLLTEGLVAALGARTGELLWARPGPEDGDPATLALLLVEAARRVDPGFGESVLALMRRHPGPVRGWEPIYRALGEELGGVLGGGAVVLENAHVLAGASPALGLVNRCLIPVLGREVAVVLLTRDRLTAAPAAGYAAYRTPKDLRLSRTIVEQWMDATLPGLPAAVRCSRWRAAGIAYVAAGAGCSSREGLARTPGQGRRRCANARTGCSVMAAWSRRSIFTSTSASTRPPPGSSPVRPVISSASGGGAHSTPG